MPSNGLFLQSDDNVILILSICVLIAKLAGIVLFKFKKDYADALKLKVILCKQPWLPALIIVLNFIGGYCLVRFAIFNGDAELYLWISYAQEIFASIFSVCLLLALVKVVYQWLNQLVVNKPFYHALLPYTKNSLYFMGLILSIPFIIPSFLETASLNYVTEKITWILVIWTIAWLAVQVIIGFENITLQRLGNDLGTNFRARRVYTQARLFKRMAVVFVFIIATALSAMAFENIREIGTSILASAGLATIILGFAAQKTLGNFFAGIQIAVTQPIRINDTVTIENEFGTVEEISLTYVVVRTWDLRRLIIPINYFLEKSFQNLSRSSTNLLCPIIFFADYNLPIAPIRERFMEILKASAYWDGQVANLQVTDLKENAMQIRALASANDSGNAWNLRCEVLEKLVDFIVKNYPGSLPKLRNINP